MSKKLTCDQNCISLKTITAGAEAGKEQVRLKRDRGGIEPPTRGFSIPF